MVTWSPPRTWVDGTPVKAVQFQTDISDNETYLRASQAFRLTWTGPFTPPVATAEVQLIKAHAGLASGGTYTLTYNGQSTGALPWDFPAASVQTELIALTTIPANALAVTGTLNAGFTVNWAANQGNVLQITADSTFLVGDTIDVSTLIQGDNTFASVPMQPTFRTGGAVEGALLAGTWAVHGQATWNPVTTPAPPYIVGLRKNGATILATAQAPFLAPGILLRASTRATVRFGAADFLELLIDGTHISHIGGALVDTFLEAFRIGA